MRGVDEKMRLIEQCIHEGNYTRVIELIRVQREELEEKRSMLIQERNVLESLRRTYSPEDYKSLHDKLERYLGKLDLIIKSTDLGLTLFQKHYQTPENKSGEDK